MEGRHGDSSAQNLQTRTCSSQLLTLSLKLMEEDLSHHQIEVLIAKLSLFFLPHLAIEGDTRLLLDGRLRKASAAS